MSKHGGFRKVIEIAELTWRKIRFDDVFGRAAQLAYYFFLALFPFLICVVASLSAFGKADRGRALLFFTFARFLPTPAFQLISDTFNEILHTGGPLKLSFGIVFSLWSASMGMSAIIDTLNSGYKATERRSLFRHYGVAIALTIAIVAVLIFAVLAILFLDRIAGSFSSSALAHTSWRIVRMGFGLALILFSLALTYHFAPDVRNRRWRWISPGSVASVFLLIIITVGLRLYYRYSSHSTAYGSLGAVIVLLLFFYFCGIAILSGGVLNGVIDEDAREEKSGEKQFRNRA